MDDPSRVGQARRHAAVRTADLGWSEEDAGRLALVVTELGNNLQRHAVRGELLLRFDAASHSAEVLSIDRGPGMGDLARSMDDGYSTGGTPGLGLGGVRRMADDFDIHTSPRGTLVLARLRRARAAAPRAALRVGAVCVALRGESACGDAWALRVDGTRARLLVADGLGHGPGAAEASAAAVRVFLAQPADGALSAFVEDAHAALRITRGAALCALALDGAARSVRVAGVGNVVGRVVSGVHDRSLLAQHGTVGVQMRRLEETSAEWPDHACVVLHSDGIETRWKAELVAPLLAGDPALLAAMLYREHGRGRDDATVVVLARAA